MQMAMPQREPPSDEGGGGLAMNAGTMNRTANMRKGTMHMTFFWGSHPQILFSGWPGDRGPGMYLLALLSVFAISAAADCLSFAANRCRGRATAAAWPLQAALHGLVKGLRYVAMLAVMSFNVGVLLAAVAGHCFGFMLSRSLIKPARKLEDEEVNGRNAADSK